ncbi:AK9 [Acanthosepion pharaonis]|uniref:AK9 n=1 Tax=Acanthosepion pharaonis TaxID=158019 RepID=A0A812C8E1_ACAPH|nr:AK9 [Sepia pharaonis]
MPSSNTDFTQSTMEPVIVQEIEQDSSEINIFTKNKLQDPYDEDESEQKFLLSKPTCFIIIGKPGCGKTTLAQKLAQFWKCELLNANMLLSEILRSSDDRANTVWQVLSKGEQVSEEIVFQLLEQKINSPEVGHHGYILDDYPNICEDFMNIQDQLERMKTWKLTPDFIINLRIPDEDLLTRRISQRIDPQTGTIYTEDVYNYIKQDKKETKTSEEETEEDVEENEEESDETEELSPEIVKNLLTRPEDLPEQADRSIQKYKSNMLRIMEEYMIDYDRDHVIELDGNQPVEVLVQQIITKLQLFGLAPAAVLQRLYDEDEEGENADEIIDMDDMMKPYSVKKITASQYPWRKSRWGKNCPVALYEGNVIPGKAEYAVSFLDKMYFLSSVEYMDKFLRNPRPYLLRPYPKSPCKISILGMPKSGKTNLSYLLADKYQAKVIQIQFKLDNNMFMQYMLLFYNSFSFLPSFHFTFSVHLLSSFYFLHLFFLSLIYLSYNLIFDKKLTRIEEVEKESDVESDEEKEKNLETEEQDQDAAEEKEKKESMQASEPVLDAEKTQEDETEVEEDDSSEDPKVMQSAQPGVAKDTHQKSNQEDEILDESQLDPQFKATIDDAISIINADHPEVHELIKKLMKDRGAPKINLPAEKEFDILYENILKTEESNQHGHIKSGRWILDGSPAQPELWQVCVENNWLPDNLICLVDDSKNYSWLMQQWLQSQSTIILDNADIDAENIKTENFEAELKEVNENKSETADLKSQSKEQSKAASMYKEKLKKSDNNLKFIVSTVTGMANLDPFTIDINNQKIEDIFEKVSAEIEKTFQYQANEYSLAEMDEDDEQFEEEENEDEENEEIEEEEEDENIHHSRKRHLGNTSYFCPVMLKEKGMLCPGKPETTVKYANKLYYLSSSDALEQFLMNPSMFAAQVQPPKSPAIRFCIIGVHGSGKTVYGRYLARKLGIFHICFHEKLQELIIKKIGRKVGPHYEDPGSETTSEESENEEEGLSTERMNTSEESNEYGELTEEEELIKANLEGDTPLTLELIENIISPWWFQEPFRSTGFILEGFPRNSDEVTAMQEFGLWFDAAIILNVEDTDIISRLLPQKIDEWKIKRDKKIERLEKQKAKAKKDKELRMLKRREELEKELEERRRIKQAKEKEAEEKEKEAAEEKENETDENKEKNVVEEEQMEEYAEEEMDIEMLLLEEFQEEEEEDMAELEEENEEDAYDKYFGEITEQFEIESSKLTSVQESLEDAPIPRIMVDAGRRQHIVYYVLNRSLRPYVEYRQSIFERVYPLSEHMARQLLNNGYKQPSCLGCWCPVLLQENVSIQTINNSRNDRYPCIYRQHIYFLSSTEAREKFIKNPLAYLTKSTKPRPIVPMKLAILGPPKCGKTHLCNKFSEKYGVERLSLGVVTRRILETQPKSHLCSKIRSYLCKGLLLPDELAIEALEIVLLNMTCQTKGYVFDGFPLTKRQMELMTARKIIPVRVILLNIDSIEVIQRGAYDRLNLPCPYLKHDSGQVLAMRYQVFQREIKPVIEWYENEHQNLYNINGIQSKWAVWEQVKKIALDSIWDIQDYLLNIKEGKAASLRGMCVTNKDFMERLGDFGQFCPVSLVLHEELVDCSKDTSMDLAAEYRGYYYKMANKENLQLFMEEPEKFVPPNAPHVLPPVELLPRRLVPQEEEMELELKGYCPVTFLDGKCRYEAIIPGKKSLIVEYKNKFYSFASEEQLDKFMRLPRKYSDLELPHKLPPEIDPIDILQLPHLGFMEQVVATPLIRALVAVGNYKPKYPFLTVTRSALLYVAYHLKAFNPRNSDYIRKKYHQKLKRFEADCELIGYLSQHMTDKSIRNQKKSEVFKNKMDTFFALNGIEPSLTWIA